MIRWTTEWFRRQVLRRIRGRARLEEMSRRLTVKRIWTTWLLLPVLLAFCFTAAAEVPYSACQSGPGRFRAHSDAVENQVQGETDFAGAQPEMCLHSITGAVIVLLPSLAVGFVLRHLDPLNLPRAASSSVEVNHLRGPPSFEHPLPTFAC